MKIELDIGYPSNLLYSNVSISIPDHGILSFVGENGSGKSTLFKTLAGMIKPMKGQVSCELTNRCFMVSESISLPEEVLVKDIMELLGEENCAFVKCNYENIYQFMKMIETKQIKKLSSGQRKVVEIFSGLALRKKYLLFDEASNALDIVNRQILLDTIESISKKDIVVFYVSHNIDEIMKLEGDLFCFVPKSRKILKVNRDHFTYSKFKNLMLHGVEQYE